VSPNGTRGIIVTDDQLNVWTFGTGANGKGYPILRNGIAVGGRGVLFVWWELFVYVQDGQNRWNKWTGTKWVSVPGDPDPEGGQTVDCVLSEWGPWELGTFNACQPNGTQSRTDVRYRTVVVEPDGGAACGPLSETRVVTQPCVYVPPPTGAWPPVEPSEPATSWPEPRVYRQSQWWESMAGDIDNATHFHLEAACPRNVATGIVRFDVFCRFFHGNHGYIFTGIRKVVRRTNQPSQEWMPTYIPGRDPGIRHVVVTEHEELFWTPVYLDLRGTLPGSYTFEFDASAIRPDGQNVQTRLIFQMWVDEAGSKTSATSGSETPEGWVSNNVVSTARTGYVSGQAWGIREFPGDASSAMTFVVRATPGRMTRFVVCLNPNMHAHPPIYGTVLFDSTFVQPASPPKFQIPQPPGGGKVFWRVSDSEVESLGAVAQAGVITVIA